MICRRTIYSFLLAVLLAISIRVWAVYNLDPCRSLAPKATVYVESGTRTIEVPCSYWIPRQPMWMNAVLLFDFVLGIVFLVSVGTDWSRYRTRRRASLL